MTDNLLACSQIPHSLSSPAACHACTTQDFPLAPASLQTAPPCWAAHCTLATYLRAFPLINLPFFSPMTVLVNFFTACHTSHSLLHPRHFGGPYGKCSGTASGVLPSCVPFFSNSSLSVDSARAWRQLKAPSQVYSLMHQKVPVERCLIQ